MFLTQVTRNQRICALCKYWNGTIGSTTIQMDLGSTMYFKLDSNEKHTCFKPGQGMEKSALQSCPYFRPRYDE